MAVFNHISFDEHEQVVFCHDKHSGLKAIIAIHNTNLGPAFGGCRMWNYHSDEEALNDVLRLSKGMTYKNALAGLEMGGGKSVIIADPKNTTDRTALFKAFGRFVNSLGGRYYAAEDVGTTPADISIAGGETAYVAGLEGKSGDPSPFTALGTYLGIKAAAKHKLGVDSLEGLKIAVQGVGHVGYYLCRYLHQEGAQLLVTDIHQQSLDRAQHEFGAQIVAPQEIYCQEVDVYAPCALGATLNDSTIPQLKAGIVAGCANNQLAQAHHAEQLKQSGILYAPDYVINAGGIINVSFENHYDKDKSIAKVEQIYHTLTQIFSVADAQNRTTSEVADEMAKAIINNAKS
ncbi:Glu/Leu/Phe/Val dehydrogenase [Shewanella avicenniae]|uniref:Glu/Leu/Phe/Val dehydrogenase n=1 Tax=Shewanella avicenniae TaxID=2814294 RepID=A0ABX7QMR8_9GAMM|nr:Glu/Leu/Phe/Val dehydrogenase dimerization domain-containing protein [Shewanella avicenniae]QSX32060.1 Glu/Leu/Phe/Val dehydrogenase [Shewanella avicenniae]